MEKWSRLTPFGVSETKEETWLYQEDKRERAISGQRYTRKTR
jgi:hypothetical protein